jgi:hypothetical protein
MHMQSENFTPAADSFADTFDISWEDSVHGYSGPVQSSYPVFQFPSISKNLLIWHASNLHNVVLTAIQKTSSADGIALAYLRPRTQGVETQEGLSGLPAP